VIKVTTVGDTRSPWWRRRGTIRVKEMAFLLQPPHSRLMMPTLHAHPERRT
jgi:hypothetical protein